VLAIRERAAEDEQDTSRGSAEDKGGSTEQSLR